MHENLVRELRERSPEFLEMIQILPDPEDRAPSDEVPCIAKDPRDDPEIAGQLRCLHDLPCGQHVDTYTNHGSSEGYFRRKDRGSNRVDRGGGVESRDGGRAL